MLGVGPLCNYFSKNHVRKKFRVGRVQSNIFSASPVAWYKSQTSLHGLNCACWSRGLWSVYVWYRSPCCVTVEIHGLTCSIRHGWVYLPPTSLMPSPASETRAFLISKFSIFRFQHGGQEFVLDFNFKMAHEIRNSWDLKDAKLHIG